MYLLSNNDGLTVVTYCYMGVIWWLILFGEVCVRGAGLIVKSIGVGR